MTAEVRPQSAPADVCIVIVSFNIRELLRQCLQSLPAACAGVTWETLVVDNASIDGSADMVAGEAPQATLIRAPVNLGFAAACNRGFAGVTARYVVLLNTDAFPRPGAIARAVERMDASPAVGLAGGRLVGADGAWQPSARRFPSLLDELLTLSGLASRYPRSRFFGRVDRTWASPEEAAAVDWVPGAFCIIRRSLLERVGCFDERFFLYYEEVDLCRRLKAAGHAVWYWPDIVVTHLGGQAVRTIGGHAWSTAGQQLTSWRMRSTLLYYRKHHGARGAWGVRFIETLWHAARAWRHSGSTAPERRARVVESRKTIALMQQAWQDTRGGRVSPPRPW